MRKIIFLSIFAAVSFVLFSCAEKKESDVYNTGDTGNTQTVSNPKFSKQSGTYQEELSIEITTETKDANIYYTVDGTNPDDKSTLYSEPIIIPLETTMVIKAAAYKDKLKPSAVISSNYEVTGVLDRPEFNISPGVYTEPKSISLSHNDPDAVIKYTTDGTEPSSKSKIYSIPFSLVNESSTEIKAKAFKPKWGDSTTVQGLFVITGTVISPVFATEPGTYTEAKTITITCENPDAEIRYEVYDEDGGSDPTETSTLYTQPFLVPLDTTVVVKAKAFIPGWNPSPAITGKFVVTGTVNLPVFSPIEGTYTSEQSVTISVPTEGAVVRYTVDGSEPSELSPLHSTPIVVPLNTQLVIKAKGFKKDWSASPAVGGNYKVTGKVASPSFSIIPNYYTSAQNVAITTTTQGSSIKFTIDGTEPTKTHGNEYTGAVPIASTTTLKAIAYKTDWIDSNTSEGTYNITGQVPAPVFNPAQGNYTNTQTVSLESNIPGATIRYTIDGSNPSRTAGLIYSGPFTVSQTRTVKAFAYRNDWESSSDSAVSSAVYTITGRVSNPKFSIEPGNYTLAKTVVLSTETTGAVIRYTLDGSDPSRTKGTLYSAGIVVDKPLTIKAVAYKSDWEESSNSEIATGVYNITGKVFAPEITPTETNHTNNVEVTLSSITSGVKMRFTTNGDTPTRVVGTLYTDPFSVSTGSTVRAIAYKDEWEESSNSDISSRTYVITGKVINPKFDIAPGNYTTGKTVKITTETAGVVIRYTTDGSTPTRTNGTIYVTTGIVVNQTTTIKAVAYKTDWQGSSDSDVITGLYTVTGIVLTPEITPIQQNHTSSVTVSITSATTDASIRYTTNGTDPTTASGILYTDPFVISANSTVKAIAFRTDWEESSKSTITSRTYTITGKVEKPKLSVEAGNYTGTVSLTLSCDTTGAKIRFTDDGSTPSRTAGTLYTAAISIPSTRTIKVIAYKDDWQDSSNSDVVTATYTITGKVVTPVMTPFTGNYTKNTSVTIETLTEDAVIRYTTNGTTPSRTNGLIYTGPILVNSTTTLKAFAYMTAWQTTSDSDVVTGTFTITGKVANPLFSIEPGNYTASKDVTISTPTSGATIKYTLNGEEPSRDVGTIYTAKLTISSSTTVKAIAFRSDWQSSSDSNVVSGLYNITGKVATPSISPVAQNHTDNVEVSISSLTEGTTIRYTTDGTNPTRSIGAIYGAPFTLSSSATVKAIAYKTDWEETSNSDIASRSYTITGKVVNPKFDITPGNYTTGKTVKITTETAGVVIRYTTDGSTPTRANGTIYVTTGIVVASTATIKAIAYRTDWQESSDSDVITGLYTITGTVHAPAATPVEQNHTASVEVSLASITPGAVIRYTTDGTTNPTRVVGTLYENPFTLSSTATVKAIAYKPEWEESSNSTITSKVYTITGKVEKPKLSVEPGNYTATVSLTLSCDTAGAAMRYTIDGSDPTRTAGTLYTGAISIPSTRTIKVIAYKTDWQESSNSDIVSALYTITGKAATPVMSPVAGNYTNSTAVTITSDTAGAKIRYTTTGVNPTRSTGTLYTAPVQIDATATLKAIAYKDDWQSTSDSDIASGLYTITGKVANPIITPLTGFYMSTQSVTITCATSGAKIKYTTNGTNPSEINGFLYTGAFSVASTATVKAFAYKEDWQTSSDSDIISETLTITGKVVAPAFSPAGGKYTDGKSITITSTTQDISGDVVIRYSLDGSTPTRSSTLYTGPVFIGETKTLKAMAYVPQWEAASDSNVSTGSYTITGIVPAPTITPNGGSGVNSISVTITAPGATIKYTLDGSTPSFTSGLTYTTAISLNTSSTLKAMAFVADQERSSDSPVASATFTVTGNVATPAFTPVPLSDPDTAPVFVTISCSTPGATIRYTTNGDNPSSTSGTIYAGETITFPQPWTLKAIAYKTDWTDSPVASAIYKMKVKTPTFSPGAGTYNTNRSVQIVTETPDVTIYYITVFPDNGSLPNVSSNLYTGPVLISAKTNLKAIAYKNGGGEMWVPSAVKSELYTMKTGTPVFSVNSGIYTKTQTVEISTVTEDPVEIRYGYEGEVFLNCTSPIDPTWKVTIFNSTNPASFPVVNKTKTIKAIVCKGGWDPSDIAQTQLTMKGATPVISPATGTYAFPQEISITTESDEANIYYTTNGVEPTVENGTLYSDPFLINEPTVVKAVVLNSYRLASEISTEVFFGATVPETTVRAEDGNIQAAIDTAAVPSIINITCDVPPCQINETINMKNGVSLKGTSAEEIIVQGTLSNGIGINFPATVRSTTFIENLTVKGGGGTTETRGIYIASGASPTIKNCIIEGGNGSSRSYGIYNNGLSPQIYNNEIYGGYGADSYAVYNENSTRPLIKENYLYGGDNSQSFGIFNINSGPLIISNEIESGNSTIAYSIFNAGSNNTRVTGNDIKGCSNNSLCSESYGIYIHDNMTIYISNNLIYGGDSSVSSYGIYNKSKDLAVSNNTISGGSAPLAVAIYNDRPSGSSDSLDIKIKNNILYTENSSSGTFCLYELNSKSYFTIVKNNDFFKCQTKLLKNGTNYIVNIASVNSYDGMSGNINSDPFFIGLKPYQPSLQSGLNLYNDHYFPINSSGEPIDIEGSIRSSDFLSDPWWIGAYEM